MLRTAHAPNWPYVEPDDALTDYPTVMAELATKLDANNAQAPQYVTLTQFAALAPWTGMEVYLIVDATLQIVWHLRYKGAGYTYPWEAVGTNPGLHAYVDANESTASLASIDLATFGPSITLPRAGEYLIGSGAYLGHSSGTWGGAFVDLYSYGYAAMIYSGFLAVNDGSVSGDWRGHMSRWRRFAMVAGQVKHFYRISGSPGPGAFRDRWLTAIPVRLA